MHLYIQNSRMPESSVFKHRPNGIFFFLESLSVACVLSRTLGSHLLCHKLTLPCVISFFFTFPLFFFFYCTFCLSLSLTYSFSRVFTCTAMRACSLFRTRTLARSLSFSLSCACALSLATVLDCSHIHPLARSHALVRARALSLSCWISISMSISRKAIDKVYYVRQSKRVCIQTLYCFLSLALSPSFSLARALRYARVLFFFKWISIA